MGPPLAAHGYDVLIPLMPGHGNALRYEPDAPNWLWGYLTLGISLLILYVTYLVAIINDSAMRPARRAKPARTNPRAGRRSCRVCLRAAATPGPRTHHARGDARGGPRPATPRGDA